MLRGILTVGGWTMASRLLGFVRDILIAALIGTGPVADAFFVANKLPNLFRRLFGEGAFNAAFVPEFSGLLAAEGPEAAKQFAQEAVSVLAFWLLALTILGEIFMPQIMMVLAPGFAEIPAKFALAVELTRITFPYLLLICLAAVLSGVLNGLDRFAAAAAAPLLFNAISIAAMLGLAPYVPTVGHALAWGVSAIGRDAAPAADGRGAAGGDGAAHPETAPHAADAAADAAHGARAGAGRGRRSSTRRWTSSSPACCRPARVSLLYYAERVYQLPLGHDRRGGGHGDPARPLAPGPRGRGGGRDRHLEPRHRVPRCSSRSRRRSRSPWRPFLSCTSCSAAAHSTSQSAALSAQSLVRLRAGTPGLCAAQGLAPAFFARGDTSTPVKVGMVTLALNLALNLALMVPLQHVARRWRRASRRSSMSAASRCCPSGGAI